MDETGATTTDLLDIAADIVAAYVQHNSIPAADLPALIAATHAQLRALKAPVVGIIASRGEPAVPIKRSVGEKAIICLECGRSMTSLKWHLNSKHDLTPPAYRQKWDLPEDYPMVPPQYAAARSELAKRIGLGNEVAQLAGKFGLRRRLVQRNIRRAQRHMSPVMARF